jgi:arylsulfatase A-like enzyme
MYSDSSYARTPTYRGFDKFYGFYSGYIDYYTKQEENGYLDLQDGLQLETDETYLSSDTHASYIFAEKVDEMITDHADTYGYGDDNTQPFFLYYAVQLVHFPYLVPDVYSSRCSTDTGDGDLIQYCGLNLMLDEVVANVTCTLSSTGLLDNTIIVLASDNGGNKLISGSNYPNRGYKYDQFRGGVGVNAFIFSPLLDDSVKGTSYYGQMHVTGKLLSFLI